MLRRVFNGAGVRRIWSCMCLRVLVCVFQTIFKFGANVQSRSLSTSGQMLVEKCKCVISISGDQLYRICFILQALTEYSFWAVLGEHLLSLVWNRGQRSHLV